jgi:cytoskeletal protein RodZ
MLSWLQPFLAIVLFVFFLFASHYIWDAMVRWLTVPTRVDSVQSLAKQYQRIYQQLGTVDTTSTAPPPKTHATPPELRYVNTAAMKDELQEFLQTSLTH